MKIRSLLMSRKFWTAVLIILVLIISLFHADFDMDTDAGAGMVVVAVAYILGVAVDPGMSGWRGVLQSRKFWTAVLGFLLMVLQGLGYVLPFDLTLEQYVTFAAVFGGLIAGWALENKPAVG